MSREWPNRSPRPTSPASATPTMTTSRPAPAAQTTTLTPTATNRGPQPGVLLVGKCRLRETGNATTLARYQNILVSGGWDCVTRDPDDVGDLGDLSTNLVTVVGLHAYRCARVLTACRDSNLPYLVIFGGTDVNECVREGSKMAVMTSVVEGAVHLVATCPALKIAALAAWPFLTSECVSVLPQAVEVNPSPSIDIIAYLNTLEEQYENAKKKCTCSSKGKACQKYNSSSLNPLQENGPVKENECKCRMDGKLVKISSRTSLRHKDTVENASRSEKMVLPEAYHPLVVLVAGLRPVKDVLYVAEAWSTWHESRGGHGRLVILGPTLDTQYAQHVHSEATRLSGVRVSPSLPPHECQSVIQAATVLLNSSRSEGMASTILEAMVLGTPVVARDIPGNTSIITHGTHGLLFSCPATFIAALERLLQDPSLAAELVAAARERALHHHSSQQERDAFLEILERVHCTQ